MTERLQKIIASRGIASRRKAEEMITQGRVSCNGAVAHLGDSADPEIDVILLAGTPLPSKNEYVYIMLHKPRGFVTTLADEKGRRDVSELVSDCGVRVFPVGRLDMDSEGLLLFTNDGEFANKLMHPKHEVEKTYEVWANGYRSGAEELLRKPIELDGYKIKEPKVNLISVRDTGVRLEITIHEGRNRQVRRMCQAAGLHVTRLRRISEGALKLGDLPKGKWRRLTADELKQLGK